MKTIAYGLILLIAFFINAPAAQANETIQTVLIAKHEAVISAPISGRLAKIPFQDGDIFNKGDLLVAFDCEIEKAQLNKAQAQLDISNANMKAQAKLKELKATSELEVKIARAEQKRDKAQQQEFQSRFNLCEVRAPFRGRVAGRNANQYETIESGKALLKIASMENLQAQLLAPSAWLSHIKIGSTLSIKIQENGKIYAAHIIRIGGSVDPVSQSIVLIAQLDAAYEELLPGMSGVATFKSTKQPDEPSEGGE